MKLKIVALTTEEGSYGEWKGLVEVSRDTLRRMAGYSAVPDRPKVGDEIDISDYVARTNAIGEKERAMKSLRDAIEVILSEPPKKEEQNEQAS